jgi:hypothetical protein
MAGMGLGSQREQDIAVPMSDPDQLKAGADAACIGGQLESAREL